MKNQQPPSNKRGRSFRNWRIASKLLVVSLALSLIPLLLITWISSQHTSNVLTQEARVSLSRLGQSVAQDVSQSLSSGHIIMGIAATDPQTLAMMTTTSADQRQQLVQDASTHIKNILAANPAIDVVGFYDAKGTVLAHSDPTVIGQDFSAKEQVQRALAGEDWTSSLQVDPKTGKLGILASEPVKQGSKIVGAIAIRVTADYIASLVRNSLQLQDASISQSDQQAVSAFLLNHDGLVTINQVNPDWGYVDLGAGSTAQPTPVAAPGQDQGAQALPVTPSLVTKLQAALAAGQAGSDRYCRPRQSGGTASANDCGGDWHVIGYAPVGDTVGPTSSDSSLFLLAVDLPERVFLKGVSAQTLRGLAVSLIIAIIAVLASVTVARSISRPIIKLSSVAEAVENDEKFEPAAVSDIAAQGDEVGYLSRVFSAMVVSLRARMSELRTIYDYGRIITLSVNLDQTIFYLLQTVNKILRYDAAEISLYDKDRKIMDLQSISRVGKARRVDGITRRTDQGLMAKTVTKQEAVIIKDQTAIDEDTELANRTWKDMGPHLYLGMPLWAKGELIGALEFVQKDPAGFTEDHVRVLESISTQAAVAIQNAIEVRNRERVLTEQIQALRIEVDGLKRQKQVEEIVSTDYFQRLREQAQMIRKRDHPEEQKS